MPRVRRRFASITFPFAAAMGAAVSLISLVPIGAGAHAQERIEVSTDSSGKSGGISVDGYINQAALSADGRFVAFVTKVATLVPGDTNGSFDVFVKDVQTNVTKRVSVASDGSERIGDSGKNGVDISDDGQIVVFTSTAQLTGVPITCAGQTPCQQIFAHDLGTGQTTMVSVSSSGVQANTSSDSPSVSGDGRYVSFDSYAWNLVTIGNSGSTNVYVHDRAAHTTTRASIPSGGFPPVGGLSFRSRLNGDGSLVAFVSRVNFDGSQEPFPCPNTICLRAWIHDRTTNTTTRVPIDVTPAGHPWAGPDVPAIGLSVPNVDIDSSGRFVAILVKEDTWPTGGTAVLVYDRLTGQTRKVAEQLASTVWYPVFMSGDGRFIQTAIAGEDPIGGERLRYDRTNGFRSRPYFGTVALSATGRYGVEVSSNGGVYRVDFDHDNDRMDDDWEKFFGLPGTGSGNAAQDPDGDGLTNLEEHEAGTHPLGTVKRYLAEGAANAFFTTRIALFNPGDVDAAVVLRFQAADGRESSHIEQLDRESRKTVILTPGMNIPANDFSTLVESDHPVVVDRTMTWDASGHGAHAETSLEKPERTWYFAEGATHGDFSLFYLLQNPNATDARVTVDYLRRAPLTPVVKTYDVPARSRLTIPVDGEGPELAAEDLAAKIDATVPIVAERAMYASRPGHPVFTAGHGGAGVTSPALKWFFAEGATGSFFDLYVLVANPNASDAALTVTYLFPSGEPLVKQYTASANNRLTIAVEEEDARLRSTPVSIVVESTNNQPVVVERAMWWPQYPWYEAHLSAGATTTGTKWALAEGEVNTAAGTDTYILIANTGPLDGSATITFVPEPLLNTLSYRAARPFTVTVSLPANSRTNVIAGLEPRLRDLKFSTIVESSGVPIVVERAMYRTTGGLIWSSGTSALATKLQ